MGCAFRHRVSGVGFRGAADKPEAQHPARGRDRELEVVGLRLRDVGRRQIVRGALHFVDPRNRATEVARPGRLAHDLIGHRGKNILDRSLTGREKPQSAGVHEPSRLPSPADPARAAVAYPGARSGSPQVARPSLHAWQVSHSHDRKMSRPDFATACAPRRCRRVGSECR